MSEILDEKFKNVKKTPGNQIWRIEKLEMCEVPEKDYGIFFGGDSYILLKTIEKKTGALERRIHFWLGEESSGQVHKFGHELESQNFLFRWYQNIRKLTSVQKCQKILIMSIF